MPSVDKIYWDWRDQFGYVSFKPGMMPTKAALKEAVTTGTMYTGGNVFFYYEKDELPNEIR